MYCPCTKVPYEHWHLPGGPAIAAHDADEDLTIVCPAWWPVYGRRRRYCAKVLDLPEPNVALTCPSCRSTIWLELDDFACYRMRYALPYQARL